MYLTEEDVPFLQDIIEKTNELAFLVFNGAGKWIAKKKINSLSNTEYTLWHIPSGKLPLLKITGEDSWINDPFVGWTEMRAGADKSQPYFGAGWPGVIFLEIRTKSKNDSIGLSCFCWIGNHYRIIGIGAEKSTEKLWNKLRYQIKKNAKKIPRGNRKNSNPEIFAFKHAFEAINKGRECAINPI